MTRLAITHSSFVHSYMVTNNLVESPRCIEAQTNEDLFFHRQTVTTSGSPFKFQSDKVCNVLNISIPKVEVCIQFFSGVLLQWFCMLNIHPLMVFSSIKMVVVMDNTCYVSASI